MVRLFYNLVGCIAICRLVSRYPEVTASRGYVR